jgi:hypothetical protein
MGIREASCNSWDRNEGRALTSACFPRVHARMLVPRIAEWRVDPNAPTIVTDKVNLLPTLLRTRCQEASGFGISKASSPRNAATGSTPSVLDWNISAVFASKLDHLASFPHVIAIFTEVTVCAVARSTTDFHPSKKSGSSACWTVASPRPRQSPASSPRCFVLSLMSTRPRRRAHGCRQAGRAWLYRHPRCSRES